MNERVTMAVRRDAAAAAAAAFVRNFAPSSRSLFTVVSTTVVDLSRPMRAVRYVTWQKT